MHMHLDSWMKRWNKSIRIKYRPIVLIFLIGDVDRYPIESSTVVFVYSSLNNPKSKVKIFIILRLNWSAGLGTWTSTLKIWQIIISGMNLFKIIFPVDFLSNLKSFSTIKRNTIAEMMTSRTWSIFSSDYPFYYARAFVFKSIRARVSVYLRAVVR